MRLSAALALGIAVALLACSPTNAGNGPDASGDCGDTTSDPLNCGACSRTCVVPNASPACESSECTIDACDDGFHDSDGDPLNGCELEAECTDDSTCTTECGSTGTLECIEGSFGSCETPVETCNGIDDDCNEECDDGAIAGCRAGVHRSIGTGHLYTTDLSAAQTDPFSIEVQNYFYLYNSEFPGSQVVFLCRKGDGTHLITSSTNCETLGSIQGTLGYWATSEDNCGALPLYRLFNAGTNDHFFTTSPTERDSAIGLGYTFQSIPGYIWMAP